MSSNGSGHESFLHWAKRSPIAYVGVGLTGVGLGLGIVMSIQAGNANDSANKLANDIKTAAAAGNGGVPPGTSSQGICTKPPSAAYQSACDNYQSNVDANASDKKVATVGFVLAGVGVATIVGGYFLTRKASDDDAKQTTPGKTFAIAPMVSPSLAGFGAAGTFLAALRATTRGRARRPRRDRTRADTRPLSRGTGRRRRIAIHRSLRRRDRPPAHPRG
jgi:hypothetical protein